MKTNELKRRAGTAESILLILVYLFLLWSSVWAQVPSSRQIPFSGVTTTILPGTTGQTLTMRVLDNSNPPVALYCETQTLDVDSNGAITFNLGTGTAVNPPCPSTPPGLNPSDFASGSTRSLDVVDTNGNSVLPNVIPLRAVAFALSPGPQGPAGPKGDKGDIGPQGQQGPPGVVQAVSPGDASITIAGTAATPSVAVSANGITNAKVADGALSPSKITGTAAVLSGDTFSGPLEVAPNSTSYALRIDQGGNGHGLLSYVNTTASNKAVFSASSLAGAGFNVMGDGKVGIGTSTPGATLDVNGTAHASSFSGNGGGLTNLDATSLTNGIRVQPNGSNPPNIINGFSGNAVLSGVGVTISGGGYPGSGVGYPNLASGTNATVGGGGSNWANNELATVGGGYSNTASGLASTVPGGYVNIARGFGSFAAGAWASANYDGCFVWGDSSTRSTEVSVACGSANQYVARATGGVTFYTNSALTSGVQLAAGGGSWSSLSDRNVKEHFATVDPRQVLARVAQLPIQSWNYKSQAAGIRHIGPMAQDFYAAFHVGEDDRHITEIDEGGVALAAIQGLNQKLEDEIGGQREQISRQDQQIRQQAEQIRELTTALRQFTSAYAEPERGK